METGTEGERGDTGFELLIREDWSSEGTCTSAGMRISRSDGNGSLKS